MISILCLLIAIDGYVGRAILDMFCQDKKNNFAQITSEYAILFALIVAALVAMQIYLKRGIQANFKDAVDYPMNAPLSAGFFNTSQYEPTFTNISRNDTRDDTIRESMTRGLGISRNTTEIISFNVTQTFGDYN